MSAAQSMSSRALMTTWSSVAAGNVITNPSSLPQASVILARRADREFSYSANFAPCSEFVSKDRRILRMKLQHFRQREDASMLACILLHRYWLKPWASSREQGLRHDSEIPHAAPCRPGRRLRPGFDRRSGL